MPKKSSIDSRSQGSPPEEAAYQPPQSSRTTQSQSSQSSKERLLVAPTRAEGGSSFEARFGRVILQHGIAAIPAGLLHYQSKLGLDAKHLWFIEYILSCKWDANLPYPSLNRMEQCTGVDIQALYRYKKALCEQGYLRVYKRLTDQGGYDTNAYDFSPLFEHLEALIAADGPVHNPIGADPADRGLEPATVDSSFVARYGRIIVRYGVAAVPRAIFTHQGALRLTPQQVWFVSYIFSFKWDTALPYPSIERMALNTGYSRAYLHEIKATLVSAGYLHLVHRVNEQGGQDSNAYDFSGLLDAIRDHLQSEEDQLHPPAQNPPPAIETAKEPQARSRSRRAAQARAAGNSRVEDSNNGQKVGLNQWTEVTINEQTKAGIIRQMGVTINEHTGIGIIGQMEPGVDEDTPSIHLGRPTHVAQRRQGKVAPGRHESETIKTEAKKRDDSNQPAQTKGLEKGKRNASTASSAQSPYITGILSDFSNELNDSEHAASNITQGLRLWQLSNLEEAQFVELVYKAKQLTRQYQTKNGLRGIENKMAYFFSVLRDLCLPSPEPDERAVPRKTGRASKEQSASINPPATNDEQSSMSARQLWQATLAELQSSLPAPEIRTWLRSTSIIGFEDNTAVVAVPSNFVKDTLDRRYRKQLADALYSVLGYRVQVRFQVGAPTTAGGSYSDR